MKNIDKLKPISKNHVRYSILYYGAWNGIALYKPDCSLGENHLDKSPRLINITLTNIASLHNQNILELYKLIS